MDSKVDSDATCHFLRVPLEIRHEIYRYLLLDPAEASLDPSYDEKAFNEIMEDEHRYNLIFTANEVSEHSSSDPDPEGEGTVMYNHLIVDQPDPSWENHPFPPPPAIQDEGKRFPMQVSAEEKRVADWKRKFEDEYKVYRYPAIMQTSRQIYDEASTFMYSSLVMEVRPGYVMVSDVWKNIVEPSDKIWRSCPIHQAAESPVKGMGCKGVNLGGTMEPHVFAKFEKIAFSADLFLFSNVQGGGVSWPTLLVDDKFRTSLEDEDCLTARLKGQIDNRPPVSDIFQDFVNVLAKSPYISHLGVSLGVEIDAMYNPMYDAISEDIDDHEEEIEERKINIANSRVVELILDASVLNPLKQLENVKRFSLSFDELPCNGVEFEPKQKHLDIIKDLQKTVEDNFLAKYVPV